MGITKTYNLKFKDYFKFNLFFTKTVKTLIIYIILVGILSFILLVIPEEGKTINMASSSLWLEWLKWFAIGAAIITIYFTLITFLGTKRAYSANKTALIKINLTINEEGLSQVLEDGTKNEIAFKDLFRVRKKFGLYAFLVAINQGILVSVKLLTKEEEEVLDKYIAPYTKKKVI